MKHERITKVDQSEVEAAPVSDPHEELCETGWNQLRCRGLEALPRDVVQLDEKVRSFEMGGMHDRVGGPSGVAIAAPADDTHPLPQFLGMCACGSCGGIASWNPPARRELSYAERTALKSRLERLTAQLQSRGAARMAEIARAGRERAVEAEQRAAAQAAELEERTRSRGPAWRL